jgi:hypothetical protein
VAERKALHILHAEEQFLKAERDMSAKYKITFREGIGFEVLCDILDKLGINDMFMNEAHPETLTAYHNFAIALLNRAGMELKPVMKREDE